MNSFRTDNPIRPLLSTVYIHKVFWSGQYLATWAQIAIKSSYHEKAAAIEFPSVAGNGCMYTCR